MIKLETLNELTLKVTCDGQGVFFSKAGAFIAGESYGGKNYQFEKVLLGPQGNPMAAAVGFLARKVSGENLPLMKVTSKGPNITYYANEMQHVTVMKLQPGQTISVESENILGFVDCDYSVRFLATGVISQKGLMTSTLRGRSGESQVAILTDGNPIVLSNMQNGASLTADPDAMVAFVGADPGVKLDLSWKMILGSKGRSGESYMLEWSKPAMVIVQPNERTSGIDIGIDGKGGKPTQQDNNLFRQDGNQMFNGMGNNGQQGGGLGGMLGGLGGGNNGQQGGLGGLGNILGGIINS